MEGILFDIQKFCVHDGPGIRTTVFLKGCMMRCLWCHNPESFEMGVQIAKDAAKCTGCGACTGVCPAGVHGNGTFSPGRCTGCGTCIRECLARALKFFGYGMSAQQVMDLVLQDEKYYRSSGGGVTFSGGEPTMQLPFLLELLRRSKDAGLHTCLETNGLISPGAMEQLLPLTDLFLLDYKATGEALHKKLTGQSSKRLYSTLAALNAAEKPTVLRCPIIPGLNDFPEHFQAIRGLKDAYPCITEAELMPYHSYGAQKWGLLGQSYSLAGLESASPSMKEQWNRLAGICKL